LIIDRIQVAYCEGWDSEAGTIAGPLSSALAAERHHAGKQYAVLLSAGDTPVALIEVARGELHYGLRVFGQRGRFVSEVNCRLLDEDRLFILEQRTGLFTDPEQIKPHDRKWRRVVTAQPGHVRDSEIIPGALRERTGLADTADYWVDAPDFGDWGRFIRSFPAALGEAGLEVPATVLLDDVSVPDGQGLPPSERPWEPPWPLTPDPARLAWLFGSGTRLTYDLTRGLQGPESDEGIRQVTVEVVNAGTLRMPSGRVVAKYPSWSRPVEPFTVSVPPGEYPVLVSVARFADEPAHRRVAAAKLVIRDEPAETCSTETWEMALTPGQDPRLLGNGQFYGFGVDSGTGCFCDDSASADFAKLIRHDILAGAITGSITDPRSGTNLIGYESGWGDGSYPTWIGRAADGSVTCFVSDMLLMPAASPQLGTDVFDPS
jgi:hypothetical protein